jgi:hypothetical protein
MIFRELHWYRVSVCRAKIPLQDLATMTALVTGGMNLSNNTETREIKKKAKKIRTAYRKRVLKIRLPWKNTILFRRLAHPFTSWPSGLNGYRE